MDKSLAPAAIEWLQKPIDDSRKGVRATWRGTLAVDPGNSAGICFSLNTLSGTQRFVLSLHDARQLAESLLEYLELHGQRERTISQSSSSSGSPSVEVSTRDE